MKFDIADFVLILCAGLVGGILMDSWLGILIAPAGVAAIVWIGKRIIDCRKFAGC
jgi:hypothetical protein